MSPVDRGMEDAPARCHGGRLFTVPEANRALVLVKRIIADIVVGYARLGDLQEAIDAGGEATGGNGCDTVRQELLSTVERLQRCMEELDEVGVELVDWSRGIVDFPSAADGRKICLCWQHGQERVAQWHEVDAGSAQRQSIETLPQDQILAISGTRG
ncbi:MAG: DUF2203 domain-containing protein [Phycisphaerae bacterium]|jgi:hypothetical protein